MNSPISADMTVISKDIVLRFLTENPHITSNRDIARALHITGKGRTELRAILRELEADGKLERTAKRSFARTNTPPPTGVIAFERIDEHGDLIGHMTKRDGVYGPEIIYAGVQGKRKVSDPGVGDRALCKVFET